MRKTDQEFKYLGSCPVCGEAFKARGASVISKKNDISNVYAQCSDCKSSVSIYVIKSVMGFVTTIGTLTDMTKKDLMRYDELKPISADDILEIHKILEE
ncbi:MAG: hypothetical protein R3346_02790 [Candidatus Spechtbacterales bacterium]|nr:hypothetical protein [Candidatus Spechtbacterales bacterium]